MTWLGDNFPNLMTGANSGTFTMTFADGTLVGDLHEQYTPIPNSADATFSQILDVTGGTGAFDGFNGTLTGGGTLNLAKGTFSTSGAGTITTPEPGSAALLLMGLACLAASRARRTASGGNHK